MSLTIGKSATVRHWDINGLIMPVRTTAYAEPHSVIFHAPNYQHDNFPQHEASLEALYGAGLYASMAAQMVAGWILDNPSEVAEKTVFDIAAGSGIAAIAAAKAGASEAWTIDLKAADLVAFNADANGVGGKVTAYNGDIFDENGPHSRFDSANFIILCNFSTYSDNSIEDKLIQRANAGATILVAANAAGDMGWQKLEPLGRRVNMQDRFTKQSINHGITVFKIG